MIKIFYFFLVLLLSFFISQSVFGYEKPKIISREDWGANEEYRYLDSKYWLEIQERNKIAFENQTEYQKTIAEKLAVKNKEVNVYLNENFLDNRGTTLLRKQENNRELAWNISHSDSISGIILHHTATPDIYESDEEALQDIYKFHAIGNQWGDIGYNFLIGKNGKIYEGRAGGEMTVGAHDKWNNIGNIGISIIGDYSIDGINQSQEKAVKDLMSYLIQKYDIDLNQKNYFHSECLLSDCIDPLISEELDPIIGHRDAGHTDCPGEKLYAQLQNISFELRNELGFSFVNTSKIKKIIIGLFR